MEQQVRDLVRALVEDIAERDRREFQHEYAAVVPSLVIASMVGLDDEYIVPMRTWTEAFIGIRAEGDHGDAAERIYAMFAELLAARRSHPREDMMTALTVAEIDGERLGDDELLGFCMLLVLGGNDTTPGLLGSAVVLLAAHPDQRALLVREPSRWPAAIEEINRIESPTQVLPRTTTRDVDLHGIRIPAGSRVMLVWGAANHDDREFPDPERFDVTRAVPRHLAFGHGVHFCMGAGLARLEARIALEEWHKRFPAYELDGEPRRHTSIWARAYDHIPLRLN